MCLINILFFFSLPWRENTHTSAERNARPLSHRMGFDVDAGTKIVSFCLIDAFIPVVFMITKVLLCHRSLALSST